MKITGQINSINYISLKRNCEYVPKSGNEIHPQNKNITFNLWGENHGKHFTPCFGIENVDIPRYSSSNEATFSKPGDFQITKLDNITCPACGKKIMTPKMFEQFEEEITNAEDTQYFKILDKYEKYMRPVELNVYSELKTLHKIMPSKSSLRDMVVSLRERKLPALERVQLEKLREMRNIARKKLPKNEKEDILPKFKTLEKVIRSRSKKAPFQRKRLIESIDKYPISNKTTRMKIKEIAQSFPTSSDLECAWVVKYSGNDKKGNPRNSLEIAKSLLRPSVANTDHMLARDIERNNDDITNYMSMHNACNSDKTNKPFLKWVNENPKQRKKYIIQYFRDTQQAINNNMIDNPVYKNYVPLAIERIFDITKGAIDLREYCFDELNEQK